VAPNKSLYLRAIKRFIENIGIPLDWNHLLILEKSKVYESDTDSGSETSNNNHASYYTILLDNVSHEKKQELKTKIYMTMKERICMWFDKCD